MNIKRQRMGCGFLGGVSDAQQIRSAHDTKRRSRQATLLSYNIRLSVPMTRQLKLDRTLLVAELIDGKELLRDWVRFHVLKLLKVTIVYDEREKCIRRQVKRIITCDARIT